MNTFHDIANIYERQGESLTQPFAARMIELANVTHDDYIIDVACGTGGLAVLATTAGARVVATDISPAMVARTGERLRPYAGSEAQVMSCDALSVPDAQFDVAFSNMAVLILPVWRQGLSELVRVTKPGGRIAISAWTSKRDATPGYLAKRIFEEHFPGREFFPSEHFRAWSTQSLSDILHQAGCEAINVDTLQGEYSSAPGQTTAQALDEAEPFLQIFPGYHAMTQDEHRFLRTHLLQALEDYKGADGVIRIPTEGFVAVGRRTS